MNLRLLVLDIYKECLLGPLRHEPHTSTKFVSLFLNCDDELQKRKWRPQTCLLRAQESTAHQGAYPKSW